MAEMLPGIVVALTGDASGAVKALRETDKAQRQTGAHAQRLQRDFQRMGASVTAALSSMTKPILGAGAALASMTAMAGRGLNALSNLGTKLATAGAVAGAAVAGAVATAAQENVAAARAMASFRATSSALAVELAQVVLPAVQAVTQHIADLTAWFRSLDPEVKASIGAWAAFAAQATVAVGVAGKLAGAIGGMATFIAPMLPFAAALALAAVAAGALYKSLKDATGLDVGAFTSAWQEFAATMLGIYTKIAAGALHVVNVIRQTFRTLREDMRDVFREFGATPLGGITRAAAAAYAPSQAAMAEYLAVPRERSLGREDLLKQLETQLAQGLTGADVKEAAVKVGGMLGDGLKHSLSGLDELFRDAGKAFGLDEILSNVRKLFGERPTGRVLSGVPLTPMAQDVFAIRSGAAAGPGVFDVSDRAALAAMAAEAERYAEGAFLHAVQLEEARIAYYDAERARLPALLQAFDAFADGWHDAFMDLDRQTRGIVATAAGALQGMLGKAGSIFDAAAKGMQAGGPLGAIVGAVGALVGMSEQAGRLTAVLDAVVQELANVVGTVLEPVITTLGGTLVALRPLFESLTALLAAMTGPLEGLAAPLVALAPVFQAVAATVQVVVDTLGGLVGGALGVAFRGLFEVFKVVGIIVTGIVLGIQTVWNAIADTVNGILGGLGDILGQDWRIIPRADTEATSAALKDLTELTYEAAIAKAKETAASVTLTDAMRSTAAQLLNVPEVLRVSALRFAASRAEGLPGEVMPGGPGAPPPPTGGGGTGAPPGEPNAGVTVFIGGQPLRQQFALDARLNGNRVSAADLEGLFQGGA